VAAEVGNNLSADGGQRLEECQDFESDFKKNLRKSGEKRKARSADMNEQRLRSQRAASRTKALS
jgi:hypothetical protein